MGKPRLIILIRHAQSEGNKNRDIHQTVPDHRVKLTAEGRKQATEAGLKLRSLLRPDDTLHFYTSPYRRTRETTEGILASLTSDDPTPSPFPRHTIKVYEEPRLREQDFGNFQPCSAEMTRMWQERADYGHFFYRIPNGESAADAYDRVSGFNESLWRSFSDDDFASVCVLVTHGLMTRVFLMKWYHFSVEYFEDLRNVNHCEFVVMKQNLDNGKYVLQNHLRTWTEYRAERDAQSQPLLARIPIRKRWGGCPDGCAHAATAAEAERRPPRRQNTVELFRDDCTTSMQQPWHTQEKNAANRAPTDGGADTGGADNAPTSRPSAAEGSTLDTAPSATLERTASTGAESANKAIKPQKPYARSPNQQAGLQPGRDGGGSRSGDTSEVESSNDEAGRARARAAVAVPPARSLAAALKGAFDADGGMRVGVLADALGDQSDLEEDEKGQGGNVERERERERGGEGPGQGESEREREVDREVQMAREVEDGFEGSVR